MRLILLRGLGRDQLHWQPLLTALNSHHKDLKIETPDLPGAGILYQQSSPLKIQDYIPYLEKQISSSAQPSILAGLSLGGMIALKWAEMAPKLFTKVVLINSSSRLNFFFQRLRLAQVLAHPGVLFGTTLHQREKSIYHLTCNSRPAEQKTIENWANIQQQSPVSMSNKLRQILAGLTYKLPNKDHVPPVSIIYSQADRLVSPKCSQKLATHFHAQTYVNSWAGHDLPQDDPQWIAAQLFKIAEK